APVPRPPQPTRAIFTTPDSPACTCGKTTPASADAAAILPVVFIMSRRDTPFVLSVIETAPCVCEKTIAPVDTPADLWVEGNPHLGARERFAQGKSGGVRAALSGKAAGESHETRGSSGRRASARKATIPLSSRAAAVRLAKDLSKRGS